MKKQGFTLVELLVVVAIIALLLGILLPALNRAREITYRTTSAANVRSLVQSMMIYAQEQNSAFPVAGSRNAGGAATGFSHGDTSSTSSPGTTGSMSNNITASLWILVRDAAASQKIFVNPATVDTKDPLTRTGGNQAPLAHTWDFKNSDHISYSPLNMYHTEARRQWSSRASGNWIYLGDDNDNNDADRHSLTKLDTTGTTPVQQDEVELKSNSSNHAQEGQSFGFGDGHAEFSEDPFVGPSNDNVYAGDSRMSGASPNLNTEESPANPSLGNNFGAGNTGPGAINVMLIPINGNGGSNNLAGS